MKSFELVITVEDLKRPYWNSIMCPIASALSRHLDIECGFQPGQLSCGPHRGGRRDAHGSPTRQYSWSNDDDRRVSSLSSGTGEQDITITVNQEEE